MLYLIIFKVALKSICANKLRTALAMLGIIIGTAAVISMLSIGSGAQEQVMKNVNSIGTNLLGIRPRRRNRSGVRTQNLQKLSLSDAKTILNDINGIKMLAPVVSETAQIKYYEKNIPANVIGTSNTYFSIKNHSLDYGRFFNDRDAEASVQVAILGNELKDFLFSESDPLGAYIKVNGVNFKVIGVLTAKGDKGHDKPDESLYIPYTTAMNKLFGLDDLHEIVIMGDEKFDLSKVENSIEELLRDRHNIKPEAESDFRIFNQAELIQAANKVSKTFTLLLGSIAGISLVVGGIGIMNIMLVTVSERTREIGVRIAIGARRVDILIQFLLESILICSVGGVLGVLFGIGIAEFISIFTKYSSVIQLWSVLLSLLVSVSVGTFFGYYPARRAAFLNPIDALRHE